MGKLDSSGTAFHITTLKQDISEHLQIVTFNAKWHDLLAVYGTIRDRHEEAAARLIVR